MRNEEIVICPNCKAKNEVEFDFYDPQDMDIETEEVECECGCHFEASCEIDLRVSFSVEDIKILWIDDKEGEDQPYVSRDPNQLSLI